MVRCLALARALARLGDIVEFVLDDDGLGWKLEVERQGHRCTGASSWLGAGAAGCLLDGYDLGHEAVVFWRAKARILTVIVDQFPPPHWANIAIAPGFASNETMQAPSNCRLLAGLNYALIDPRFVESPVRSAAEVPTHVLISFGLRDSLNATGLVLRSLDMALEGSKNSISTTVTLGAAAPNLPAVQAQVKVLPKVVCAVNADMPLQYQQADLVVGGGGVSLLERMALGLPSVSVSLADNQRAQIALCAEHGGTIDAGNLEDIKVNELADTISSLLHSRERRAIMSTCARKAVDGLGAERCARVLWEGVRAN